METTTGKVHEAIAAVMAEVAPVGKERKNTQQNYNFRGIADVYAATQRVMAKHHIHIAPHAVLDEKEREVPTRSGGSMLHIRQRIEFRIYHADGSFVPIVTTGEAMDSGDKTSNKVMSAAMKYALIQAFALPEDDPDADTETQSPERAGPSSSPKAGAAPASSSTARSSSTSKGAAAQSASGTSSIKEVKGPAMSTPLQVRNLAIALGDIGVEEKKDRLFWIGERIGRMIESSKELTFDEAERLIGEALHAAADKTKKGAA